MLNFNEINLIKCYFQCYSGSSYSADYNAYNFFDISKLFAVLNMPANYL